MKMSKGLALWAALLGLAFPAACGSSGVVGGECSASYVSCDGQCVDAQNDPANCGGCKRACDDGVACHNAICGGSLEGGAGTSGNGGNSGTSGDSGAGGDSGSGNSSGAAGEEDDAGNLSDANPDGDAACAPPYDRPTACGDCETKCSKTKPICSPDGMGSFECVVKCQAPLVECDGQCVSAVFDSPLSCGACNVKCPAAKSTCSPDGMGSYACVALCKAPLVRCDGQCVPPVFDTPDACGACDNKCPVAKPTCSPDGLGNNKCVLICDDPLKECNGQCVDFNIDTDNCGSCGNVCESGICQGGMCVGAFPGNVVLACMNYQNPAPNSPQTVLMGNAVFSKMKNPTRILSYTEYASAASRAKVDQDVGYAATARNTGYSISALSDYSKASAALSIAKFEVFLIYDQDLAPTGDMATVGAAWQASSVLDSFAAAGGTIIVLSGGTTEMDQFITSSGLLDVSAQSVVAPNSKLYRGSQTDWLGVNVISPFAAPTNSCTFTTSATQDASTQFVIGDAAMNAGAPVVVHRVIGG